MATASHSQPRPRHRSKPKFDVPVETAPPVSSNGWVYRQEPEREPAGAPRVVVTPKQEVSRDPFQMIGEGVFLIGLGTVKLMYRATTGLITAPFRLAGMFGVR